MLLEQRLARAEATTRIAREIIEAEKRAREEKTARLRAERLQDQSAHKCDADGNKI